MQLISLIRVSFIGFSILSITQRCTNQNEIELSVKDPNSAEKANIDRFSDAAGHLMVRSQNQDLPLQNQPIHFDKEPFITQSLGPDGQMVRYYNFDIQPLTPAPIYVFFKKDSDNPVKDQLNLVNAIPGDFGYNDFWLVTKVIVPDNYLANSVTSYQELINLGYPIEKTTILVNCPIVPEGSTAHERYNSVDTVLHRGWYDNMIVYYFTFGEKALKPTTLGLVPVSPIYVTFNTNPDSNNPLSGPPSGFVKETGSVQTHNVIATLPENDDYSPLWIVNIYDNQYFNDVKDLESVKNTALLVTSAGNVNCPVVFVE